VASFEITVRAHPRASRNTVVVREGSVHVYTTAPPVDGEANDAIVAQLAKHLGVAKSLIQIVRGESGREKVLRIEGEAADFHEKLSGSADE